MLRLKDKLKKGKFWTANKQNADKKAANNDGRLDSIIIWLKVTEMIIWLPLPRLSQNP